MEALEFQYLEQLKAHSIGNPGRVGLFLCRKCNTIEPLPKYGKIIMLFEGLSLKITRWTLSCRV